MRRLNPNQFRGYRRVLIEAREPRDKRAEWASYAFDRSESSRQEASDVRARARDIYQALASWAVSS